MNQNMYLQKCGARNMFNHIPVSWCLYVYGIMIYVSGIRFTLNVVMTASVGYKDIVLQFPGPAAPRLAAMARDTGLQTPPIVVWK